MKLMKVIAIALLFIASTSLHGQLAKGNAMLGGSAGLSLDFRTPRFQAFLSPNYLKFVNDNLALGGSVGFSFSSSSDIDNFSTSVFPSSRYYFSTDKDKMALYFDLAAGVRFFQFNSGVNNISNTGFTLRLGPGVSHFISEDVAIDTGLSYNYGAGDFEQSILLARVGLQVFLVRSEQK